MVETRSMSKESSNGARQPATSTSAGTYLSPRALAGLKAYKYKSGGDTWLDYLHMPVWHAVVEALPMWLAPNLITLTGMLFVIAAYVLSILNLPEFQGDPLPRSLYFFFAAAVFIYVNLDCMDGRQARRTGSSSPLGQLFDHGCDALSLHMLLDTVRTSLQLPGGWGAVTMEMAIMVPWMMAHWEEYHTGTMLYSNGWVGVLEGNYALMLIHLVTGVWGPDVWDKTVIPEEWMPAQLRGLCIARNAMLAGVAVLALWSVLGQLYRVLIFPTTSLSPKEVGNKQLGHGASILHLAYISVLILFGWIYLTATPVGQDPREHILQKQLYWNPWEKGIPQLWVRWGHVVGHARSVGLTWGVVYALIASQLILAHMCKEPFHPYVSLLACLGIGCANTLLGIAPALLVDTVILAMVLVFYIHYVTSVINQISSYLGINCLTIKHKETDGKKTH